MEQTKDSIAWLRDYITAIKSGRFHPFTPLERKAREATRNEAWYISFVLELCSIQLDLGIIAVIRLLLWTCL